ncbi:DUF418 domain-containing protein [Wenzhouxiangella sp. XN79A]|uniref:DUF418 domain-containing protein n=1 Tax=Wenzhouxiangella sp. XN79A TaxID=2724193 RepID=UPI00144AB0EF|nr:DUF418 domain-containing protein [Wenzhouxiangella sp. XN79A]NKI36368.1 DUF418 domain-containing protein [Wenzhouxiangella sp. XN79A]
MNAPGPAAIGERIELLDALRGVALLGILLANMMVFSGWVFMSSEQQAALAGALPAEISRFLFYLLLDGKFYTVFSLLFGIGFAVQLERLSARRPDAVRIYTRRLLGLLLIGLFHLMFIWVGDILTLYALIGFTLLLARNWSNQTLTRAAVALILLPVPAYVLWGLLIGSPPGSAATVAAEAYRTWASPNATLSWVETMRLPGWAAYRDWVLAIWPFRIPNVLDSWRIPKVMGLFFLGACIGRRLMAGRLLDDTPLLERVLVVGLIIGLPANLVYASLGGLGPYSQQLSGTGLVATIAYAVGVVPLGLAYAAALALLWRRGAGWLRAFAPAGRMALTNYLMHSVVMGLVFLGYGLGLAGQLAPWQSWLLAGLTVVLQILLSRAWLARFRFGPAEWLWRWATYGTRTPLRIIEPAAT